MIIPKEAGIEKMARMHNVSHQVIKKVLRDAGNLENNRPTEKALKSGLAVRKFTGDAHDVKYFHWNTKKLVRLTQNSNIPFCPQEMVWSGHSALDRLREAAKAYQKVFPDVSNGTDIDEYSRSLSHSVCEMAYEGIDFLEMVDDRAWRDAELWVVEKYDIVSKCLKNRNVRITKSIIGANKKVEAVISWLAKPRK
ncbi:hypothetical protein ACTVH1_18355 [Gluconobacter cerinus]